MATDNAVSQPPRTTLRDVLGRARSDAASAASTPGEGRLIEIDSIDPNPFQHRLFMDPEELDELIESIRVNGLLEPIVVRQHPDHSDRYQLIADERRCTAFRRLREAATAPQDSARFTQILAVIKSSVTDRQMRIWGLIENGDRASTSPVEQGLSLAALQQEGLSTEQIAAETGWEINRVKRLLRIVAAPDVIKDGCTKGIMVPLLDDDGKPLTTPKGRTKQEHRHLDLMAALEFASLYQHWAREKVPVKKATERVEKAILKALTDGWSFRRIQEYCRELKAAKHQEPSAGEQGSTAGGGEGTGASSPDPAPRPPPYKDDERQLVVYRSRLVTASPEQRRELRALLSTLLETL